MSEKDRHDDDESRRRARGFDAAEEAYLDICLSATPAERVAWLEEAIELAAAAGVLPRLPDQAKAYTAEEVERIERERWNSAHLPPRRQLATDP